MQMKRKLHSLVLPMLMLGACFGSLPAAAEDCVVKMGATGPLTGGAALWGLSGKAAVDFLAKMANNDGGLQVGNRKCKVEVKSFDAQYTAAGGAAAANYFASENVHIVNGPIGAPEVAGWRPVAARNGIISFTTTYKADVPSAEFPLMFKASQTPLTWGKLLINAAKEHFHFKSVMILGPNDQGGTDSGHQFAQMYSEIGAKVIEEYYQRGTTNFSPLAARIVAANPDTIETSSLPPGDASILVRQLLEAGYKGAIGSLGGVAADPIVQGAGGVENLKAVYYLQTAPMDNPGVVRMVKEFTDVMQTPPPSNPLFPVLVFSAEQIFRAVSLAGTDQDIDKLSTTLRTMQPKSRYLGDLCWRGKGLYGMNQELAFPVGLGLIIDGKKLPVQEVPIPCES
jgi:branched-chain amino acid transport system substrate-binding protein